MNADAGSFTGRRGQAKRYTPVQEGEELRVEIGGDGSFSTGGTASPSLGRPGVIPVLASPFASNATSGGGDDTGNSHSQTVPRRRRTRPGQDVPGRSAGPGVMSPHRPSLGPSPMRDEDEQEWEEQEEMTQKSSWRPAMPMGKAASLTRAMSINRTGSLRPRRSGLPGSGDSVTTSGRVGDASAPAQQTSSPKQQQGTSMPIIAKKGRTPAGSDGDQPRKKKLGRPISYTGDINAPHLTEEERRHLRRRELNRASARRVRAKAAHGLEAMCRRLEALEAQNAALLAQVEAAEKERARLQAEVGSLGEQLMIATANNQRLSNADQARMPGMADMQMGSQVTSGGGIPSISIARQGVTVTSCSAPHGWQHQGHIQMKAEQQCVPMHTAGYATMGPMAPTSEVGNMGSGVEGCGAPFSVAPAQQPVGQPADWRPAPAPPMYAAVPVMDQSAATEQSGAFLHGGGPVGGGRPSPGPMMGGQEWQPQPMGSSGLQGLGSGFLTAEDPLRFGAPSLPTPLDYHMTQESMELLQLADLVSAPPSSLPL